MQYINHQSLLIYSAARPSHWRDIRVTSEHPGPDYVPVLEGIPERPYKKHVGWDHKPQPATVEDVSAEAERRISEGFLLPDGSRFRCDTTSIARLMGIVARFKDAANAGDPAPTVKFRTAAGIEMTVTSLEQAEDLQRAATEHVAVTLEASATLQAMDPIPTGYADESYWS